MEYELRDPYAHCYIDFLVRAFSDLKYQVGLVFVYSTS